MVRISGEPSGISLHYEKHKGNDTSVNGLQRHNERVPGQKHSNKNIKDERTHENVFLHRSPKKYKAEIEEKITQNREGGMKGVRKDAVRMVEATVQLSGRVLEESEEKQEEVLRDMYEWLKEEHGEENIISAVIHKDETNMHLHFDFVPITKDGELSANKKILTPSELKRRQRESLEYLQGKHKVMNFKRGESETKGLSQKDFEAFKELQAEHEQAMNEYSDQLDEQEEQLDEREEQLNEREAELNGKANKLRQAENEVQRRERNVSQGEKDLKEKESSLSQRIKDKVKKQETLLDERREQQDEREAELNKRETSLDDRETAVSDRESTVEGRETAVEAREIAVDDKDRKAGEKLLKAQNERSMAEQLLEQVEELKAGMAERWNEMLDKIRNGALKPAKVEKVAEQHEELSPEDLEDLSNDILELVKGKDKGKGLSR